MELHVCRIIFFILSTISAYLTYFTNAIGMQNLFYIGLYSVLIFKDF